MNAFQRLLLLSGISGAAAVSFGAFGAHALRQKISPESLAIYQTAVDYHFIHTLAALLVVSLLSHFPGRSLLVFAASSFLLGIVLFSGSLYALALGAPAYYGLLTPVGGVLFICAWLSLAITSTR